MSLIDNDFLKRWEHIVDQVDKEHIPIDCVKKVIFRTRDRRQKTINLLRFREQGLEDDAIEHIVQTYIEANEPNIASMEFVLDVKTVANRLQPETDKLLKDI